MKRYKIGGVPEHFNLPWKLAMEEGLFRKENIHLHWEDMTGGTGQMIRGLDNKTLDIAVLLTEGISQAILKGLDAKILQVFVTSPLRWGIHVPYGVENKLNEQFGEKRFAISRTGSGSHLMAYVLADQQGWDFSDLKFNIIGDVYGGLWALQNREADYFLWEHFTTKPFVDQGKVSRIGDVETPWPCFVIAVRNELLEKDENVFQRICQIVNERALKLKKSTQALETFSWRYNLNLQDVRKWFQKVEWNYEGNDYSEELLKTVEYLKKLKLLTEKECEGALRKLTVSKS